MRLSVLFTLASPLAAAAVAVRRTHCSLDNAVLPDANGSLTIPDGLHPVDIALGVGTQNYTCKDGKYTCVLLFFARCYSLTSRYTHTLVI